MPLFAVFFGEMIKVIKAVSSEKVYEMFHKSRTDIFFYEKKSSVTS